MKEKLKSSSAVLVKFTDCFFLLSDLSLGYLWCAGVLVWGVVWWTNLVFSRDHRGGGEVGEGGDGEEVVATARGVFTHEGGTLSSPDTGVAIIIPPGALPIGSQQEIYFKVCRDTSMLPPLDQEKGKLPRPAFLCGSVQTHSHCEKGRSAYWVQQGYGHTMALCNTYSYYIGIQWRSF